MPPRATTSHPFFPPQLKLEDYPTRTSSPSRDSPSPTKKRRVLNPPPPPQQDSLLSSRLSNTLKLRDAWSDIARRHSYKTTSTSTTSTKHRPTGRTRAIPVEQDDIIDLVNLRIVKDRGVLRNSRKGSFAIGGYFESDHVMRVVKDTGKKLNNKGFEIVEDDDDDQEEEEENAWQDEDEEEDVSWEEPDDGETDSEDELAEFDDLQSLPSLKYREEKRKTEERRNDLKSFWEEELEWTAGKSAWDTQRLDDDEEEEEDKSRKKKKKKKKGGGKPEQKANEVLEKPLHPPQSRDEFRRELIASCTPKPPSLDHRRKRSLVSTVQDNEEEETDDLEFGSMSSPLPPPRSFPFSTPPSSSTSSLPNSRLNPSSSSRSTPTPSRRLPPSASTATSTIRRKLETLDFSSCSSSTPSTSALAALHIEPETTKILSMSPSKFPGDRRSIFSRDSAPPPQQRIVSLAGKISTTPSSPISSSPLRECSTLAHPHSPLSSLSTTTMTKTKSSTTTTVSSPLRNLIVVDSSSSSLPRTTTTTTTIPKTKTRSSLPSPPNSRSSNVSSSSSTAAPFGILRAEKEEEENQTTLKIGKNKEREERVYPTRSMTVQRPTPEATPPFQSMSLSTVPTSSTTTNSQSPPKTNFNKSSRVEAAGGQGGLRSQTRRKGRGNSTFELWAPPPSRSRSESLRRRSSSTKPSPSTRTKTSQTIPLASSSLVESVKKGGGSREGKERMDVDEEDELSIVGGDEREPKNREELVEVEMMEIEENEKEEEEEEGDLSMTMRRKRNYGLSTPPVSKGRPTFAPSSPPDSSKRTLLPTSVPSSKVSPKTPSSTTTTTTDTFKVPALPPSTLRKRTTMNPCSTSTTTPPHRHSSTTPTLSSRKSRVPSTTPNPRSPIIEHWKLKSSPSTFFSSSSSPSSFPAQVRTSYRPSPSPVSASGSSRRLGSIRPEREEEEEEEDELTLTSRSTPAPVDFTILNRGGGGKRVGSVIRDVVEKKKGKEVKMKKGEVVTPIRSQLKKDHHHHQEGQVKEKVWIEISDSEEEEEEEEEEPVRRRKTPFRAKAVSPKSTTTASTEQGRTRRTSPRLARKEEKEKEIVVEDSEENPHPTSSSSSSTPLSPSSPSTARSVLGNLVNSVVETTTTAVSNAASGVTGEGGKKSGTSGSIRTVEATNERVWIASNTPGGTESKVGVYRVKEDGGETGFVITSPPAGSPRKRTTSQQQTVNALELIDQVHQTTRKPIDRIAILPLLSNKAIILSEGILTFHSLPTLAPLNVHQFPSIRGVATFSLDEDELLSKSSGRGRSGEEARMQLVAIKKRSIHWLSVGNEGLESIKDLPLPDGALLSVLRRGRICIADQEFYSIVDLQAAEALPLLPISQAPNIDPLPSSSTGTTSPPPPHPHPQTDPSSSTSPTPDPRQRPSIACVGTSEFLIASHTASTTLGVFVNEFGEPCRGTLEWSSNLRSLLIINDNDEEGGGGGYSLALLWNGTIEVHSLVNQEIVQVVTLNGIGNGDMGWKSLVRVGSGGGAGGEGRGLDLGSVSGRDKTELVQVSLSSSGGGGGGRRNQTREPPSTPVRGGGSTTKKARTIRTDPKNTTKALVVGKNSVYALSPLTLVVQADGLIEKGRVEEVVTLVEGYEKSHPSRGSPDPELAYIYLRLAYLSLVQTTFQTSFDYFLRSQCDPRIVVKLFNGLGLGGSELMGKEDTVEVCRGLKAEVESAKTIDEYVLDNLNHNYSPHLQPSVETAHSTIELRTKLVESAKDCLRSYLMKWRIGRREGEQGITKAEKSGVGGRRSNDSRKVDMVVDTALVSLLAEANRPQDIKVLLASPNDCVLPQVEQCLLDARLYQLVAELALKKGRNEKVLEIWTKIVDGEYEDPTFESGPRQVFDLVWKSKDKELVEKHGLWLIKHDRALGIKLFNDPKQTLAFDTRSLFVKMRELDTDAADMFLEGAVLQEKDTDSRLHVDLVKRYLGRLGELMADADAKAHLREQETDFVQLESSTSSPPTFLSFLASRYSPESHFALLDRVRLKAILFLSTSSKYDVQDAKRELEELGMRGLRGLTLERIIVYGKLKLDRQALALLLHTLRDLSSAETYSLQVGDPLVPSDVSSTASKLQLPLKRSRKHHSSSSAKREEEARRKEGLARILVEMCLTAKGEEGETGTIGEENVSRILETQAMNLDTIEVLPTIPDSFPLHLVTSFFSRSLRRSLHTQQEASILKNLASGQNLVISERLFEVQEKMGGVVDRGTPGGNEKTPTREKSAVRLERSGSEEVEGGGEKEITVVPPSMSLEDAVELDLR